MSVGQSEGRLDVVLVGAGLANGLIALKLLEARPELSILVLEGGASAGGNHTWSFHETDLSVAERRWLEPFVVHRWPGYDVVFPGFGRRIDGPYWSVTSDRFAALLTERLGSRLRTDTTVMDLSPTEVVLASGERIVGGAVIDGRGPAPARHLRLAYQKFLGLELQLTEPHGLDRPTLMDATVEQLDGYRFVYLLPFAPDRLLIEDTYYSDGLDLDPDALEARIMAYARARGWRVETILRQEAGVLPIALGGDIGAFWREAAGLPRAGLRAGLFHPTTGYSLPDAMHLAAHLATLPDLRAAALFTAIRAWSMARWRRQGFFRFLNRMLFEACAPNQRFAILRRFYGLPNGSIRRFYAGSLSVYDKLRLVTGKPPIPILDGLRVIPDKKVQPT